jgi:hypothetical protein
MEPKEESQNTIEMKPFYDRPFEEEEDGYIDDRGFYTSPNGSFWDDDHNYFNHLGFDKHGGTYDKFGIYHPGPNYNTQTGTYQDEEMNLEKDDKFDQNKIEKNRIFDLQYEEKKDKKTVQKFGDLIESEDESDEDEADKSNISYDINDLEEAYGYVMANENKDNNNISSQHA